MRRLLLPPKTTATSPLPATFYPSPQTPPKPSFSSAIKTAPLAQSPGPTKSTTVTLAIQTCTKKKMKLGKVRKIIAIKARYLGTFWGK